MSIQHLVTINSQFDAVNAAQFFQRIAAEFQSESTGAEQSGRVSPEEAKAATLQLVGETVQQAATRRGRRTNAEIAADKAAAAAAAATPEPATTQESTSTEQASEPAAEEPAATEEPVAGLDPELAAMLGGEVESPPAGPNPYADWTQEQCWARLSSLAKALTVNWLRPWMPKYKVQSLNAIPVEGMRLMLHEADQEFARREAAAAG